MEHGRKECGVAFDTHGGREYDAEGCTICMWDGCGKMIKLDMRPHVGDSKFKDLRGHEALRARRGRGPPRPSGPSSRGPEAPVAAGGPRGPARRPAEKSGSPMPRTKANQTAFNARRLQGDDRRLSR